jgi:Tol biopolymer transport system component
MNNMNNQKSIKAGHFWIPLVAGIIASGALAVQTQSDHKLLFEKARFTMETKGDLQGAIKLFQEIVAKYPKEKEYASKAQLFIGLCYEKLGNAEAVKAYELVLRNFADRPEEVAVARERLASLRNGKSAGYAAERLLPPDVDLESLAMSPDGTKVAGVEFSAGQNIAVFDLASQKLQQITQYTWSNCYAYSLVFSPDGREIVYSRGCWDENSRAEETAELCIATLDGKTRIIHRVKHMGLMPCAWLPGGEAIVTLTYPTDSPGSLGLVPASGGSFKILHTMQGLRGVDFTVPADVSPDGRYVVFHDGPQAGKRDIYIIGTDGGKARVFSNHPADDKEPRWSPDGTHVVFLSNRHGSWGLWGVPVKDGSASGPEVLLKEGMDDCWLLNWTRSGLALTSNIMMKDVYVASLDSVTCRIAQSPKPLDFTPTGWNSDPVWSPDGNSLAFASYPYSEPGKGHIILLPSAGGEPKKYSLAPLVEKGIVPKEILWLPDGSGLGFAAQNRITDQFQLCELKWDSAEWTIRPVKETGIRWSRDGKSFYYLNETGLIECSLGTGADRIVYAKGRQDPKNLGGSNLAFSKDYQHAAWGDWMQVSPQTVHRQVRILDLTTGKTRDVDGDFDFPQWSPDGQHLLVVGEFTKNWVGSAIYVVDLNDGKARKLDLGNSLPKGSEIVSINLSPDGRRLAFDGRLLKSETLLIRNVLPQDTVEKTGK